MDLNFHLHRKTGELLRVMDRGGLGWVAACCWAACCCWFRAPVGWLLGGCRWRLLVPARARSSPLCVLSSSLSRLFPLPSPAGTNSIQTMLGTVIFSIGPVRGAIASLSWGPLGEQLSCLWPPRPPHSALRSLPPLSPLPPQAIFDIAAASVYIALKLQVPSERAMIVCHRVWAFCPPQGAARAAAPWAALPSAPLPPFADFLCAPFCSVLPPSMPGAALDRDHRLHHAQASRSCFLVWRERPAVHLALCLAGDARVAPHRAPTDRLPSVPSTCLPALFPLPPTRAAATFP